jgi:hypothetical protein
MITIEDLADPDEDGATAREYFADLQTKARAAGHELTATASGFMLKMGAVSRHAGDLRTIAALLMPKQRAAT